VIAVATLVPMSGNYLSHHRDRIRRLFGLLDEPWDEQFERDPVALVRWMEQHWLGGEHGPGETKRAFTAAEQDAVWPLLGEFGLVDRLEPSRCAYDEVVVLGAAGIGIYRRLGLVRESGVTASRLTVLAGQRPHSGLSRDGDLDELLAEDGRFGAAAGWRPPAGLEEVARILRDAGLDALTAARAAVPSETDLARLLLGKHWPELRLLGVRPAPDRQEVVNELGFRSVAWEDYGGVPAFGTVQLLDAAPVKRWSSSGEELAARPTSRSQLREWAQALDGRPPDSLLVVVNQPHLARVRLDVEDEVAVLAGPVEVEVVGCEVLRGGALDLNLVLGEIPARINAEARRRNS
jgi:hypothetical protein